MTDNWHINNNKKEETSLQTLKATDIRVDRKTNPIEERVTRIENKTENFIKERSNIDSVRDIINEDKERDKIKKGMVKKTLEKFERPNSENKEVIRRKLDIKDEIDKVNNSNDSLKEMMEKHNNKEEASSVQTICKKLEKESSLKLERQKSLIETKEEVGKVKHMLKENSAFKESLRRKLDTKNEIGKVNKGRKNNNDNLKEKANSDSVVKVKMEVVNKKR